MFLSVQSLGLILLSFSLAVCGALLSCIKRMYDAETIIHSVLPGSAIGIMFSADKFVFTYGYLQKLVIFFTTLFYIFLIKICNRSKIGPSSTVLAISGSFGIAYIIMNILKKTFPVYSKLPSIYVNGSYLTIGLYNVAIYAVCAAFVLLFCVLYTNQLKCYCSDSLFAKSCGISSYKVCNLVFMLTSVCAFFAVTDIGIIFAGGIIIIPSVCARMVSNSIEKLLVVSGIIGLFLPVLSMKYSSYIGGLYFTDGISYSALSVVMMSIFLCLCISFGKESSFGYIVLYRAWLRKQKAVKEDLIMVIYEKKATNMDKVNYSLKYHRLFIYIGIKSLQSSKHLSVGSTGRLALTKRGIKQAKKTLARHLLLEKQLHEDIMLSITAAHDVADDFEHYADIE